MPQLSLQQDAAPLSFRLQDLASLLLQHDIVSFPEAISLLSFAFISWCAQQACVSFASPAAILSQHEHFALSFATVLCCGAEGAWVAVWAQDITVRAKIRANVLNFMAYPPVVNVSANMSDQLSRRGRHRRRKAGVAAKICCASPVARMTAVEVEGW